MSKKVLLIKSISKTDKKLTNPSRLVLLELLYHGPVTFTFAKHFVDLADGNLASHFKALIDAGYLKKDKLLGFKEKIVTLYTITELGKFEYVKFRHLLKEW